MSPAYFAVTVKIPESGAPDTLTGKVTVQVAISVPFRDCVVGAVQALAHRLKELDATDAVRIGTTRLLLDKLYAKGLIPVATSLEACDKLTVSAFCRRRLPVVMARIKMAETVKAATTLIQHGHVRIGPEVVRDPAFFVTRSQEDHLTWVDQSKIRRILKSYNDQLDDYELLNS